MNESKRQTAEGFLFNEVQPYSKCLVVGAGLSGLLAANELQKNGVQVLLLEALNQVGGRMAIYQQTGTKSSKAIFDSGAQFFTVREQQFNDLVNGWLKLGLVSEWSRGFATGDGSYYADGHPRFRSVPNMAAIARHLAQGLDVRLGVRIDSISFEGSLWSVHTSTGQVFTTEFIILTPPVPLSLELLIRGGIVLAQSTRQSLEQINYEPCIALMVELDGSGRIPEPGGMWPIGEPIAWIADNFRKGVSPIPGAITIHAGPEFSQANWQTGDETVTTLLLDASAEWFQDPVKRTHINRWPYSRPLRLHPEPYLAVSEPGPLLFAGDAFAGPRVEGAALSGLAAAQWLLNQGR